MITVKIESQTLELDEETCKTDKSLKDALVPYYPAAANAKIERKKDKDGNTTSIEVVKQAGTKGAETAEEQGWGNPNPYSSQSKFHYFKGGYSLCGKWARINGSFELEDSNDNHKDNCAVCKKKIVAQRTLSK